MKTMSEDYRITHNKSLTGQKFGKLTAVDHFYKIQSNGKRCSYYKCSCECGNTCYVKAISLTSGKTKSCGCLKHRPAFVDISGKKFGYLTVLRYTKTVNYKPYFEVICDCGCKKEVIGADLKSGRTISCGCVGKSRRLKQVVTHGHSKTKLYKIWLGMNRRCFDPNNNVYKYYGQKGIKVCPEWSNFIVFEKWAKSNGYEEGLSIERIDFNKDYCPENCKWIPRREQALNTSRNIFIELNGKKKCLKEWCDILDLPYGTIQSRIYKGHYTPKEALLAGRKIFHHKKNII